MNKKILLYFGDETNKQTAVEQVLRDMQIPYLVLGDEDIMNSVGYHMGMDGFCKQDASSLQHFSSDLMILRDIEDEEISTMNSLLQALHVSMKRKAMLTKHNQHWSVCDLLAEIEKEHQYFMYVEGIQKILTSSRELIIEHYTKKSWKRYEEAFYIAYECIQKESTLDDVEIAYQQLVQAKKALEKLL